MTVISGTIKTKIFQLKKFKDNVDHEHIYFLLATLGALRVEGGKRISLTSKPSLTKQFPQKLGEYSLKEPKTEECDTNCKFHPLYISPIIKKFEAGNCTSVFSPGLFLLYLNISDFRLDYCGVFFFLLFASFFYF